MSLIKLKPGDPIIFEDGREFKILDLTLTPNGVNDLTLVCIVVAVDEKGNKVSTTSNRFITKTGYKYEEHYPTAHMLSFEKPTSSYKHNWNN